MRLREINGYTKRFKEISLVTSTSIRRARLTTFMDDMRQAYELPFFHIEDHPDRNAVALYRQAEIMLEETN